MKLLIALIAAVFSAVLASPTTQIGNVGKAAISPRLVGGRIVFNVSEFPFIAAISVRTSNTQFFCSGTLINSLWVLTSGQCVYNAELFTVQLGSNTLTDIGPNRVVLSTSTSVIHPEYNPITYENDVGLIQFRTAINFTDFVKPIDSLLNARLPTVREIYYTLGWGQTSDDVPGESNYLKHLTLVSSTDNLCKEVYGEYATEKNICAAGPLNEGTCVGDSGAPLFRRSCLECNEWVHSGIASYMRGNGCESEDPSAFTRTEVFFDWIQNVTDAS